MRRLLVHGRTHAARSWIATALVGAATLWSVRRGALNWSLFGVGLMTVLALPAIAYRSRRCAPPSTTAWLAAVPFVAGVLAPGALIERVATFLTVAATALVIAIELDAFTRLELQRGVAVAFVVMTTMTVAAFWQIAQWLAGVALGTSLLAGNDEVMWRLVAATVTGLGAGVLFDQYLERLLPADFVPAELDSEDATEQVDETGESVTDALSTRGLAETRQRQIVHAIQAGLLAVVALGIALASVDVVVTAIVGLVATVLPRLVVRDGSGRTYAGLALWVAVAVGLHTMGTLAFYGSLWGWDEITHTVSGTMIAIAGYTIVRALDSGSETVTVPKFATILFVVLFTVSMGVLWEILEFTLDGVSAALGEEGVVLTQYGLDDTITDMIANTVGALVVGVVATGYQTQLRIRGSPTASD